MTSLIFVTSPLRGVYKDPIVPLLLSYLQWISRKMQVLTAIGKVLLAALAVSAAKLPLPSQPSTLYEAPLEDLPVPAQTSVVPAEVPQAPADLPQAPAEISQISQGPADVPQVPAQISTLYEAPAEDLPSQSSIQVQSSGLPVSAHETDIVQVQSPGGLVPGPAEPSVGLGLPSETLSVPHQQPADTVTAVPVDSTAQQQPGLTHTSQGNILVSSDQPAHLDSATAAGSDSSVQIIQEPAVPSTLYEAPAEESVAPIQQSPSVPTAVVDVPVPAEPTVLKPVSVENSPVSVGHVDIPSSPEQVIPVPDDQNILIQTQGVNVPVPAEPTVLQPVSVGNTPVSVGHVHVPSSPEQAVPVPDDQNILIQTQGADVPVPAEPTVLQPVSVGNTPVSVGHVHVPSSPEQAVPVPDDQNILIQTQGADVPVPVEPTVLQPVSVGNTPVSIGHAHIPSSPEQSIPASDEQHIIVQTQDELVPVPDEPSTLYGVPDEEFQVSQAPIAVLPEQTGPISQFGTPSDTPAVIIEVESSESSVPAEPSGLYETPDAALPAQADSSLSVVQSPAVVPSDEGSFPVQSTSQVNVPVKPFQAINFPEEGPLSVIIPVPSVPSTLYEAPVQSGKAISAGGDYQNILEIPAASALVTSIAKGGVMMGMPYNFQWGVDDDDSGAMFAHVEKSDGKSTSGQYRVTLPDGRVQIVDFYDNGDGFHANISYE
ncbi:fibrous sheath CABYR-binding protein-like isoform X2 [Macrobrachium rosenbergii]|uniref:fibrous sheath CABYR-binding protein-like isoform X2 n=1 Tax=Macrobrachium rosenbergii TaxID=79674 RepID=UPI0034D564D4